MKRLVILLISFIILCQIGQAQIVVDTTQSATQLAQSLVGGGVILSNIVRHCPSMGSGSFTAFNSNLGINKGIVLTSGFASSVIGPNISTSTSGDMQGGGDFSLNALIAPDSTKDACTLEFDALVTSDTLVFNYVFV